MSASHVQQFMMRRQAELQSIMARQTAYVGLAFTEIDDVVGYIKENNKLTESDKEIGKR